MAAAGSGKTALLSSWARTIRGHDVLWFGADRHDDLGAVASDLAPRSVVVVDDAHLVATNALHDVVALTAGEAGHRVVLGSRRELALPWSVLCGPMTELRARDLRFTLPEATSLAHHHAPDLSAAEIRALWEITDGWAAALVLATLHVTAAPHRSSAVDALSRTPQPLLDYLATEAYASLPASARDVLLAAYDEPRLDRETLAALTADPAAAESLDLLADDGLLVTADRGEPGHPPRWRLHPLLVEMLRRRVAQSADDAGLHTRSQLRAVRHFTSQDRPDRAMEHALRAGDESAVHELLRGFGGALLAEGRCDLVLDGLAALSEDQRVDPILLPLEALARRDTDQPAAAARLARAAIEDGRPVGPADADAEVLCSRLRLWLATMGWHDIDDAATRATEVLGCRHDAAGGSQHALGSLSLPQATRLVVDLGACELRLDRLDAAALHLEEAQRTARLLSDDRLAADAMSHRCLLELAHERFASAEATAWALLDGEVELSAAQRARATLARAWAAFDRLDLEPARQLLSHVRPDPTRPDGPLTRLTELLEVELASRETIRDERQDAKPLVTSGDAPSPLSLTVVPSIGVPGTATTSGVTFTKRQTDVLRELALGGSYRDIAAALYVTENTVKTHLFAIYRKLGVERRPDALRRARELGLI